jgi:hypothetical protein
MRPHGTRAHGGADFYAFRRVMLADPTTSKSSSSEIRRVELSATAAGESGDNDIRNASCLYFLSNTLLV